MKEYRENLTTNMISPIAAAKRSGKMKQQTGPQAKEQQQQQQQHVETTMPRCLMMECQQKSPGTSSSPSVPLCRKNDEIDLAALREAFELDYANSHQQKSFKWGERNIEDDFVDICDDDILSMWKSIHPRAA